MSAQIEVKVTNNLQEGTSIHFHGFLQKDTQWMDGVPGVSQCPIAPNNTFTYRTRAQLYGSAWYVNLIQHCLSLRF